MNNQKLKLFLDFDGTIVNTIKSIVECYNEDFKYYKNFHNIHWCNVSTWDFEECNCATKEYINTYFNQQRFFDRLTYMDWAEEVILILKNFYEIIIVSNGNYPNLEAKKIWIKDNLPYCKFIGVDLKKYKDKSHIDMGKGSIFIDDSERNLFTSNAEIKICFGEEYPWNKNWSGLRVKNWVDLFKEICKQESKLRR